jgi:hypothetical protein
MHRPLHVEDELPVNPYINARLEVHAAAIYLWERESKTTSGRKPRLGHHELVLVPRRFYVQIRMCDLIVLSVMPAIAWEVSRVLKVTTQAGATMSLRHSEFCEYGVHMEWFEGTLFFMRGWEAMVNKLGLWKDDVLVFELDINWFDFTLIRATSSIEPVMKCKRHGVTVVK